MIKKFILSILSIALGGWITAMGAISANAAAPVFNGTWYGTIEDSTLTLKTFKVVVAGGNITQVIIGGIDQALTGTITLDGTSPSGLRYMVTLNNGAQGGFFSDATHTHVGYVDNALNVAVLEIGATSLPTYASADIDGNWSGIGLNTPDFVNITYEANYSASCSGGSCQAVSSVGGNSNITLSLNDAAFGRYTGSFTNAGQGTSGYVTALLTPDKSFGGAYACSNAPNPPFTGAYPGDCDLIAWSKTSITTPVASVAGGGGGCTLGSNNGFDPTLLLFVSLLLLIKRKRTE